MITDYTDLPRGFHQMDGIFGIAGPNVTAASGLNPHQVLDAIIDAIPQPDVELGSGRAHG